MGYQHHNLRNQKSMSGMARIILATAVVYVAQQLTAQPPYFDKVGIWFGLDNASPWQLWRWFTYMFAHDGLMHFGFNMYALYIFGPMVERELGRGKFYRLYFLCGILGAAFWMIANPPGSKAAVLVGASAAISGVLVTAAVLRPHDRIMLLIPPIPMSVRTLAIVLVSLDAYMVFSNSQSNVAHLAHLGGAFGAVVYFRDRFKSQVRQQRLMTKLEMKPMTHTCATCGVTERDDPHMLFRVCSQCAQGEEYCETHLREHEHSAEA